MESYGFIHDKLELKILILYILNRLPERISLPALADLTLCDPGITYFDFAECLAELVETGQVTETNGMYAITETGSENGKIAETTVPYSVRMKAGAQVDKVANAMRRNAMIDASHSPKESGGVMVHLALRDGLGDILSTDILLGCELLCVNIEEHF